MGEMSSEKVSDYLKAANIGEKNMRQRLQSLLLVLAFLLTMPLLRSQDYSLSLTSRQLCDLEMIFNGGFEPLEGFLGQADYQSVVHHMRLSDGCLWPMPIMLDISEELAQTLCLGDRLLLKDREFNLLAIMTVKEKWRVDKELEAQKVFGTKSTDHPSVSYLYHHTQPFYVSGPLDKVEMPNHYCFTDLRQSPRELKAMFREKGWHKVVAFQTRNPMHQAHVELTRRAMEQTQAHLLLQPIVGLTKPGDVDPYTRVACYRRIIEQYPEGTAMLSVLPLAMRMAGPREALWHAIIRKNCGATHFIVGRDHASPGKDSNGNAFYGPYDAHELVKAHAHEIGIEMLSFQEIVYLKSEARYAPRNEASSGDDILTISGTDFRHKLYNGLDIPDWFSYPEVIQTLRQAYPNRKKKGVCLFFTGLSGSGKSTLTHALYERLTELQTRSVFVADGDDFRKHLSAELGFSKRDRGVNVRRAGYVANVATQCRGIAICAFIAPYQDDRDYVRNLVTENGGDYIEIYLSTPLAECEHRDPKGLYAKARQGIITQFTGISDPYEIPQSPELTIDTSKHSIKEAVEIVTDYLRNYGYL